MPIKRETLRVCGTRHEIRKQVIMKFIEEEPGSGKGINCSKYVYEVDVLKNGSRVLIKRPAPLNKGVDFTVHIENIKFREKGFVDMPSHDDIISDLIQKKAENPKEYQKVKMVINKLYNCQEVKEDEYLKINYNVGHPIEAILKAVKWLFIEQDVTYWNWSGRCMLYTALKERDLC